jgi:hypothetical protein
MMASVLYTKTAKGIEEARERKHKLDGRTHTALMLVAGTKPAEVLMDQWRAIGAPSNVEQVLVTGGFIEAVQQASANAAQIDLPNDATGTALSGDAHRFLEAELFMEQTVMSAAGFRSYFFQLKLQKCSTVDDLAELLPAYEKMIEKGSGEQQARVLSHEARRILGC